MTRLTAAAAPLTPASCLPFYFHSVAQAIQLLADAGAAAAEAAGPAKEESPGVFGMLVLGVQVVYHSLERVKSSLRAP